jgi:hypothetical protein
VLELGLILCIGPNRPPSPPGQWHWEAASCGPETRWCLGEAATLGRGVGGAAPGEMATKRNRRGPQCMDRGEGVLWKNNRTSNGLAGLRGEIALPPSLIIG